MILGHRGLISHAQEETMRNLLGLLVPIILFCFIAPGAVQAGTLRVASNGVDSGTCGGRSTPCRSISQAITNAFDRDRIVVGPGVYNPAVEGTEPGCVCMIHLNKSLTVESRDGAEVTVLDVSNTDFRGVFIDADGVRFGRRWRGFTLANAKRAAVVVNGRNAVEIVGNTAIGNGINGKDAYEISGSDHTIAGNVATGNTRSGFGISGTGHTFINNVASNNLVDGFFLTFVDGRVRGNVAMGNIGNGMSIDGNILEDVKFTRNTIVDNQSGGVGIRQFSATVTFTMNNIYGNAPGTNCGLENVSGKLVDATKNYWGAASGPGPDPADDACFDGAQNFIITVPFATKPFNVPKKAEY